MVRAWLRFVKDALPGTAGKMQATSRFRAWSVLATRGRFAVIIHKCTTCTHITLYQTSAGISAACTVAMTGLTSLIVPDGGKSVWWDKNGNPENATFHGVTKEEMELLVAVLGMFVDDVRGCVFTSVDAPALATISNMRVARWKIKL